MNDYREAGKGSGYGYVEDNYGKSLERGSKYE